MIVFWGLLWACIDPPKELPSSRITSASTGSMIQFGELSGFLVTRGKGTNALLWKVDKLTPKYKQCALAQVPNDTKALLVDQYVALAQTYLKLSTPPSPFVCAP